MTNISAGFHWKYKDMASREIVNERQRPDGRPDGRKCYASRRLLLAGEA